MVRVRIALVALLGIAAAVSCVAPAPSERVPNDFAATLQPDETDIAYGTDPAQQLDVYLPTRGGNRGVIITVHGGGFVSGSRTELNNWFGLVAKQVENGYAIVNIDYRLTTPTTNAFPAALLDLGDAIDWVRDHGATHGLNTTKVIAAGHSAGGAIVGLYATSTNTEGSAVYQRSPLDGWISFGGIMDLRSASTAGWRRPWLHTADIRVAEAASVVTHLDAGDPPGFVVHGDRDYIVSADQMSALETAARRARLRQITTLLVGDPEPVACREHTPLCGVPLPTIHNWLASIRPRLATTTTTTTTIPGVTTTTEPTPTTTEPATPDPTTTTIAPDTTTTTEPDPTTTTTTTEPPATEPAPDTAPSPAA